MTGLLTGLATLVLLPLVGLTLTALALLLALALLALLARLTLLARRPIHIVGSHGNFLRVGEASPPMIKLGFLANRSVLHRTLHTTQSVNVSRACESTAKWRMLVKTRENKALELGLKTSSRPDAMQWTCWHA
ncbi:MAG TPA: hypothetical protein VNH44_06860 [Micropepsaceae bacterium]|nr:hypothetical protein [Micropepsaceae bacterium]